MGQVGYEHQQYILIQCTDFFRGSHAIQPLHLYIKEDQIPLHTVVLQDLIAIRITGTAAIDAGFRRKPPNILYQPFPFHLIVLDDRNIHICHPFAALLTKG